MKDVYYQLAHLQLTMAGLLGVPMALMLEILKTAPA